MGGPADAFDFGPAALLNAGSGLLVAGVGAYVGGVRPTEGANRAFAAFAGTWGVGGVLVNLVPSVEAGDGAALELALWAGVLLILAASAPLVVLALRVPRGPAAGEGRRVLLAAIPAVAFLGLTWGAGPDLVGPGRPPAVPALIAAHWFALFLWAQRFSAHRNDAGPRRQVALMSAALALYPGIYGAEWLRRPGLAGDDVLGLLVPVLATALAALWLRHAASGPDARMARGVAWLVLASTLVGVAFAAAGFAGTSGTARTLAVLVLAFAVVRHQFLGVDVKVRWTIRQSTVAAVFVTVFFVASEGAQEVFGDGNAWFGIAAAGMLVFAMAPLQRAAERVASAAVPGTGRSRDASAVTGPGQVSRREEQYRVALRAALRDARLTEEEGVHLAGLADSLGLGAEAYERIRQEVERELAGVAHIPTRGAR